jgi:hypothetical protein
MCAGNYDDPSPRNRASNRPPVIEDKRGLQLLPNVLQHHEDGSKRIKHVV